jgi:hypothetical protein
VASDSDAVPIGHDASLSNRFHSPRMSVQSYVSATLLVL